LKGIYEERIIAMRVDDLTERKWRRVREQMRQEAIVALVLSENGRTRYISGYQRYYTATYLAFVHAVVMTMDTNITKFYTRKSSICHNKKKETI